MGNFTELLRQKMFLHFFYPEVEFFLDYAFFSFFLFDLFINKARELEFAESNPIIEYVPNSLSLSLSLCWLGFLFPLFLVHFLYISLTIHLSLSLSLSVFVDAALQLLLCGVTSSSLILIIKEL